MKQMFAEPQSPWALDAADLDRLRQRVTEGEAEIQGPKHQALAWPERTRREAEVQAMRRQLQTAEFEATLDARHQAQHQRSLTPGTRVIRERPDSGAFLIIHDEPEPAFLAPVPYYKPPTPAVPTPPVANSAPVTWPELSFLDHYQLVQAAAAELRRRGLA